MAARWPTLSGAGNVSSVLSSSRPILLPIHPHPHPAASTLPLRAPTAPLAGTALAWGGGRQEAAAGGPTYNSSCGESVQTRVAGGAVFGGTGNDSSWMALDGSGVHTNWGAAVVMGHPCASPLAPTAPLAAVQLAAAPDIPGLVDGVPVIAAAAPHHYQHHAVSGGLHPLLRVPPQPAAAAAAAAPAGATDQWDIFDELLASLDDNYCWR